MSEVQKKWYVLRAISGKEHKVKEYIDYEIAHTDLCNFVSQVLIPTEKIYQVKNGKRDKEYPHKRYQPDLGRVDDDGCIGQDEKSCHYKHQHA